jgi:hypothetical protein
VRRGVYYYLSIGVVVSVTLVQFMPVSSYSLPSWIRTGTRLDGQKEDVDQKGLEQQQIDAKMLDKNVLDKCLLDTALASERYRVAKVIESKIIAPAGGLVDTRFTLYPLTKDEAETAYVLVNGVDENGETNVNATSRVMRMAPTHNIDTKGELCGYRFSTSSTDSSSVLPINHEMFHGTSAVHCLKRGHGRVNEDAVRLLADVPWCEETMRTLMKAISQESSDALSSEIRGVPSFDCFPIDSDCDEQMNAFSADQASRMRDAKAWVCEEPVSIGIYHAYARRFKDVREHCLFIVCTGGCRTACDQFMNIAVDLASADAATAQELCDSQEVWWLRTLCSRMRGRLINRVAQAFGLPVLTVRDPYSFDSDQVMFLSSIETLSHDVQSMRRGSGVSVYNECVNTSTTRNGVLCSMNMSEGYWLFKGPPSNCDSTLDYGSVFGNERECGIFPTSASRLSNEQMTHNMNHGCHVVMDACSADGFVFPDETQTRERSHCIKFDEAFMRNLETMGWQRDNGIMEMMPIVVGVF